MPATSHNCSRCVTVCIFTGRGECANDSLTRTVECESCGEEHSRDEMFWCGDLLIGDCCDSEVDPR